MVNADDDSEYIQINDFYTYNAYKWWQLYGLTADSSTSYTNTLNSISQATETGTFTFSGNLSGSFDASVSLTYTGTTQTGSEGNTFWSSTTESGLIYDDSFHGIEMTISPDDYETHQNNGFAFACTYNAQSTSATAVMTCSPTSGAAETVILPDQTITIDEIRFNSAGSIQTNLFLSLLNQGTEVGSLNGSLGMSGGGTGSLSLTENGTTTTTTLNTNSLAYTLPLMNGTIDNSWSRYDFRDDKPKVYRMIMNKEEDPTTLIFLTSGRMTGSYDKWIKLYGVRAADYQTQYTLKTKYTQARQIGAYCLVTVAVYTEDLPYANDSYMHIKFYPDQYNTNGKFLPIIPLYVGNYSRIPDDLYRFAYGRDRNIEAIQAQTAADQQHHDEMMDTSDSAQISTDGNALVEDADEKFGDLFFPLQHAVDTAHDLANVNATGVIRLPAIFKDDYWYLDLTVIERNLPQAWAFIQSLCQLAVAIYMIKGLYNLFFGGGKEDDS